MAICSATASATASATSPGSLALKQLRSDSEQREIDDFEEEERRIMSQDSGPQDSQVGFFSLAKDFLNSLGGKMMLRWFCL